MTKVLVVTEIEETNRKDELLNWMNSINEAISASVDNINNAESVKTDISDVLMDNWEDLNQTVNELIEETEMELEIRTTTDEEVENNSED